MKRYPWLSTRKTERELPIETPIWLGNRSNGEYFHLQSESDRAIRALALEKADANARRLGVDRRQFLASAAGMATTLWAIDVATGCNGKGDASPSTDGGNGSRIPDGAMLDEQHACELLDTSREFVFDIQTHHVNPLGAWRVRNPTMFQFVKGQPQASCGPDAVDCFSVDHYIEQVFLNSDTTVAVLTAPPAWYCSGPEQIDCGFPLDNDEIVATRELVNRMASSERLLNHTLVIPNGDLDEQLAMMEQMKSKAGVAAWKLYPGWGPKGVGYDLDDEAVGIPVIEKGRALGVKIFCAHKGLPLAQFDPVHNHPRDVGRVAKRYPDCVFIVYHSAINQGANGPMDSVPEGPYDPNDPNPKGVNTLIRSVQDAGLSPGPSLNVYAELGGCWGRVMTSPDQAAHTLGKLLKYVGEDNVVWGTDCIWTGSPQPQLEAFRVFQISTEFQERYGYPPLTTEIKRKILGLNAARVYGVDPVSTRCAVDRGELTRLRRALDGTRGPRRWALQPPAGPHTPVEYWNMARANAWRPG
jgi:predicted TIM-barrel fold metal-dependent hydrolase